MNRITRMDAAHIARVSLLWEQLVALHGSLDARLWRPASDSTERYVAWLHQQLARGDVAGFVALDAAERDVHGFLLGGLRTSPPIAQPKRIGYISDLFVSVECRGRGIGTKLVDAAETWFLSQGVASYELTVATANPDAVSFWKRRGLDVVMMTLHKPL